MGDKSAIEWTDASWNPVTGCSKVSPGCEHCYAESWSHRYGWTQKPWNRAHAAENVVLHPERLDMPLRWRKPRRIFVNSMSDLFHEEVPDEFIAQVFAAMRCTPRHAFQILTKRPERMREWFSACAQWDGYITHNGNPPAAYRGNGVIVGVPERWPLPNVWLGTSVEDQRRADQRIPHLLATPAAVRFLSCEPLLGSVDLKGWIYKAFDGDRRRGITAPRVRWVIVGGESGPDARPMHPDWARSLRDQCQAAGVPFFFKQWGAWYPETTPWNGRDDTDGEASMTRVGKRKAGRLLDGREWDEMPTVTDNV